MGHEELIDKFFETLDECHTDFNSVFLELEKLQINGNKENEEEVIKRIVDLSSPLNLYLERKKPHVPL